MLLAAYDALSGTQPLYIHIYIEVPCNIYKCYVTSHCFIESVLCVVKVFLHLFCERFIQTTSFKYLTSIKDWLFRPSAEQENSLTFRRTKQISAFSHW